jgi:hypothetical protein
MNEFRSTVATLLAVALLLGAYVYEYFNWCLITWEVTPTDPQRIVRTYDSQLLVSLFIPAAFFEGWLTGQQVETDLDYFAQ